MHAEAHADEVKGMLDRAYKRAKSLMDSNPEFLEALTKALLDRRVLCHAEILALANGGPLPGRGGGSGRHRLAAKKPALIANNDASSWGQCVVEPEEVEPGYEPEPEYEEAAAAGVRGYTPYAQVAGYQQEMPVPAPTSQVPAYSPTTTVAVREELVPRVGTFKRRVPKHEPSWLERFGARLQTSQKK